MSRPAAISARRSQSAISVLQVDGFVIAVEFERGWALFLGAEAGILGAAEGQLILNARAGQVDGEQAGLGAVNEFEGAREIGGLNRRGEAEGNVVGDAHGVFEIPGARDWWFESTRRGRRECCWRCAWRLRNP